MSECCIILLEMSCWAFVLYERVCAITLYIIACIHESRKYFLFMFFVKFRETTGVFRMHWPNLCVKYFHVTRFMRVLSIKLFFHICYFWVYFVCQVHNRLNRRAVRYFVVFLLYCRLCHSYFCKHMDDNVCTSVQYFVFIRVFFHILLVYCHFLAFTIALGWFCLSKLH